MAMTDTIICSRCGTSFSVLDESDVLDWECTVCFGTEYELEESPAEWGYTVEDEDRRQDNDRLREY